MKTLPAKSPLDGRPGLITTKNAPIGIDLRRLAERHKLLGCVLISFTQRRKQTTSTGVPGIVEHMEKLGDRILAEIDDGMYDVELGITRIQ